MQHILVCDDERDIVAALKIYLESDGYCVHTAYSGEEALRVAKTEPVQLALMDIMMPGMDGITAMAKLREFTNIPVILLTAKSEDSDKILGLSVGADDYITKPYNPTILLLRISAVLKRSAKVGAVQKYHDVEVSTVKGSLIRNGSEQILTKNEMIIFQLLLDRQGEIVTRDALMTALWDNDEFVNDNALSVNISRLRGKLAELGLLDAIETRKKQGYVLK